MRAAQELLGALTVGGGSAGQRVVAEGVKEVKYALQAARNVQKWHKNSRFTAHTDLKIAKNAVFT